MPSMGHRVSQHIKEKVEHLNPISTDVHKSSYEQAYEAPLRHSHARSHSSHHNKKYHSSRYLNNYDDCYDCGSNHHYADSYGHQHGYNHYDGDYSHHKSRSLKNSYMEPVHYESHSYIPSKKSNKLKKSRSRKVKNANTLRDNLIESNLREENAEMRKELHRLRKLEAGWFGKNKNFVKKEVIVKNNHYLEEKEIITNELTSYKERVALLEKEKLGLLNRIKALEEELLRLKNRPVETKTIVQTDTVDYDGIINQYKNKIAHLNALLAEKDRIINDQQIQIGKYSNMKTTTTVVHGNDEHYKQEIAILNSRINELKQENLKYQDLLRNAKTTEKVIVKEYHDPVHKVSNVNQHTYTTHTVDSNVIRNPVSSVIKNDSIRRSTHAYAPLETKRRESAKKTYISLVEDVPVKQTFNTYNNSRNVMLN